MNSKSNKMLFGIIILLLGIFSLIQNEFGFSLTDLTILAGGFAFILLFKTKGKTWALIPGAFLSYLGIIGILDKLLPRYFMSNFIGAMFFIVPGIIFLVLFFSRSKSGLLIPASILIWLGIFVIIARMPFFVRTGSMFICCFGMSLITMYLLGKHFIKKLILYIGVGFVAFGVFSNFGIDVSFPRYSEISKFFGIAMILSSILIIFSAFKRRR